MDSQLTFLACSLGRHCTVVLWLALMSVHEMFAKFKADLWAALAECQARFSNFTFWSGEVHFHFRKHGMNTFS